MELVPQSNQALAPRQADSLNTGTVMLMLKAAVDKGVTTDNAAAVEKMVDLLERVEAMGAKKDFIQALKLLQSEAKAIKAVQMVPNRDGSIRYVFAPFEVIMEQAQPMLDRHGFVVSFNEATPPGPGMITKVCELMHVSGHSKTNGYSVHIGEIPGASKTQNDGGAHTYAKRGALCDALNIRIDKDTDAAPPEDDARAVGGTINPETAKALRNRLLACGGDELDFIAFATGMKLSDQATVEDILYAYLTIPKSKLAELERSLAKKEGRVKK